jgi:hypothetical protein
MRRDLISEVMREMGRKGGKAAKGKGVKARMAALSPEERKELARKAANARWASAKNVKRVRKKKDKSV